MESIAQPHCLYCGQDVGRAAVPVSCLGSWPGEAQRNLCMDVPSLFDSLVEYIISAFLGFSCDVWISHLLQFSLDRAPAHCRTYENQLHGRSIFEQAGILDGDF